MKNTKSIRISTDKNGKKLAYRISIKAMREFRIPVDEAELMIATGNVNEVVYGPSLNQPFVTIMGTKEENGTTFIYSSYVL